MHARILARLFGWLLMLVGFLALVFGAALAVPLAEPPELASIRSGAQAVGTEGLPNETRFHARDGTELAYRLYPAENGARDRLAIAVHGSVGSSLNMNAVAHALAKNGIAVAAIDVRGHGGSGTRGDIAYLGQLDDDMADLVGDLRIDYPAAQLILVGHSAGGGLALRVAGEGVGAAFTRFVLLAPFLGYRAPTTRAPTGHARWTQIDIPRLLALYLLARLGIDWAQSLPVVAFAVSPTAAKYATARYSYRLLANFGPPADWRSGFAVVRAPVEIIVGQDDELMDAEQYPVVLQPFGAKVHLSVLPGVDHMGVVYQPPALAALLAAVKE